MYAQAKLLVPTIKQIIKLGNDFNNARDDFDRRYPSITGKLSEHMDEYRKDPALKKARNTIEGFMMELSEVEIDLIRSIMYIGREERRLLTKDEEISEFDENDDSEYDHDYDNNDEEEVLDPVQMLASSYKHISGETKEIAISSMLQKSPLPDYLRDGIIILKL